MLNMIYLVPRYQIKEQFEKDNCQKESCGSGKHAEYQGETKAEICVKMHTSLVYKGLEWVDLQKRNRKQMYDQIKKRR